jgi:hypothetical protein
MYLSFQHDFHKELSDVLYGAIPFSNNWLERMQRVTFSLIEARIITFRNLILKTLEPIFFPRNIATISKISTRAGKGV